MKDHYAILGIASDASGDEVRSAYRRKACSFTLTETAPGSDDKFRDVQEAYETLSDAARRYAYDENRRRNLLEKPLETAREIWKNYLEGVLQ
jgi:DnaJ-class molecular chaperone